MTKFVLFPARTHEQQRIENMRKHPLREPCSCHFDCRRLISEARRKEVWAEFWSHHLEPRKAFTRSLIDDMGPGKNLRYHLLDQAGNRRWVCRTMFAHTLGYLKNSLFIYHIIRQCRAGGGLAIPPASRRGKGSPLDKDCKVSLPIYD